jgi:lysine decarboxylase
VFLVEPSYLGGLSDRAALIELAHAAGLPVIVDQAWGAHFGLHPALPPHALAVGADVMVLSAHKTLPAYSQASVIVARTAGPGRLEPARLERAFEAANTTSPAGSILASIDGARALLAHEGPALAVSLLGIVARARERLRAVDGLLVPGPEDFPPGRFDAAKLVVGVAGTGAPGVAVEDELIAAGLPVEMADHDTVVPIVTVADTEETVGRLVEALIAAVEAHRGEPRALAPAVHWTTPPPAAALDPRAAFFAPAEPVPADEAVGRICAEVVAPYPPGVPVLVPGEVVTAEILAALRSVRDRGTRIAYAADPTLTTLQVLSPSASPPLSPRS